MNIRGLEHKKQSICKDCGRVLMLNGMGTIEQDKPSGILEHDLYTVTKNECDTCGGHLLCYRSKSDEYKRLDRAPKEPIYTTSPDGIQPIPRPVPRRLMR